MTLKKNFFFGLILMLSACSFFSVDNNETLHVSYQFKNLTTGEILNEKNTVIKEGDEIEKITIVRNKTDDFKKATLSNTLTLNNENNKYDLELQAGEIKVFKETIPVTKEMSKESWRLNLKQKIKENNKTPIFKIKNELENKTKNTDENNNIENEQIENNDNENHENTKQNSIPPPRYLGTNSTRTASGRSFNNSSPADSNTNNNTSTYWDVIVNRTSINNNFDTFFNIQGNNLRGIKNLIFYCNNSKTITLNTSLRVENNIQINIPAFSLENGTCQFGIKQNDKTLYAKTILHIIKGNPDDKIYILDIVPNKILQDKDNNIVIQGRGFDEVLALQLSNGTILSQNNVQYFLKHSDNAMTVRIPKGLEKGEYYFNFQISNDDRSFYSFPEVLFNVI